MKRTVPVCLLTSVLLLCVDLQLRSSTAPSPPQTPHPSFSSPEPGQGGTEPPLMLEDVYIAVKTTGRFRDTRLELLLQTWISKTKAHTFIFTDVEDEALKAAGTDSLLVKPPLRCDL